MNIHPQYIEKIASEAFWSFVFNNNLQATGFPVEIEDIPEDLWSREVLLKMLEANGDVKKNLISQDFINELYYAVAEVIIDHNKREKNITGILYQEDFKYCRDPHFPFKSLIDEQISDSDLASNYQLKLKGKYSNEGMFFLRTPFPSGVLLKSPPPKRSTLYIPNTLKALGFKKTFILHATEVSPLPSNKYDYNYFVTGVFYIPTTKQHDLIWLKLIPNAIAVLDGFKIYCDDTTHCEGRVVSKASINKGNFWSKLGSFFK